MNRATKFMILFIAGLVTFFIAFWLVPDNTAGRQVGAWGGAIAAAIGIIGYFSGRSSEK